MNDIIVKPANIFMSSLKEYMEAKIPKNLIGYYQGDTINKLPYVFICYTEPQLPKFNTIGVVQSEYGITARGSFSDMGVGDILRCGFIIEPTLIGEIVADGFEDGLLNGYEIMSTNTNASLSKLVKIDDKITSGVNSKFSAKIMSSSNQTTQISCKIKGPFDFSFKWKVSSEARYDVLRWLVDGIEKKAISGEVDWEEQSIHLDGGEHEIVFSYKKDGSSDVGLDCGWIDDIVLGKTYKKYDALNIPTKIGEEFSLDITKLIENVNYITAFVENPAGIAISENIIYRNNNGWENGKICNVLPNHINKIILGKYGISRRKIKEIYIGKIKL